MILKWSAHVLCVKTPLAWSRKWHAGSEHFCPDLDSWSPLTLSALLSFSRLRSEWFLKKRDHSAHFFSLLWFLIVSVKKKRWKIVRDNFFKKGKKGGRKEGYFSFLQALEHECMNKIETETKQLFLLPSLRSLYYFIVCVDKQWH